MAIKKETLNENLTRTYSDEGFRIMNIKTGQIYDEAIDPIHIEREYVEIAELVEVEEEALN